MKEYVAALVFHGGMFSPVQAARIAGVSHQRISQLVKAERLPIVEVGFETPRGTLILEELIPGNALRKWMDEPRKRGVKLGKRVSQPELAIA